MENPNQVAPSTDQNNSLAPAPSQAEEQNHQSAATTIMAPATAEPNLNQAFVSSAFVGGQNLAQPKKSKRLLILISAVIAILFISGATTFLLISHKSDKMPTPPKSSSSSIVTKPAPSQTPATSGNTSSNPPSSSTTSVCGTASGADLSCYSVPVSGSVPAFAILFFSGAVISSPNNSTSELDAASANSGEASIQISNFGGDACTSQTGSTEMFSYTSNGTAEVACNYTVTGGGYQYAGTANLNGTSYNVDFVTQDSLSSSIVDTIFSSIKPS